MEIIRARTLGFCMGVKRAVELACAEARRAGERGSSVFSTGPLIHNPKVLDDLKAIGIDILNKSPQKSEDSLVICAHGINPETENDLRESGCRIIDATCPNVKASQLKAQELSRTGYCLFLAGEAEHAEIKGILGYARDAPFCIAAGSAAEAEKKAAELFKIDNHAKTAVLGQTTISEEEYNSVCEAVKKYFPDAEIICTICTATGNRLNALREMIDKADAVLIAGGKESANTRRLLSAAQESGKPCVLAESAADVPVSFSEYKTVGISAGASTPDSVINEIEQKLLKL
ncbi:MAG: 4-hydroxy-3-methylbut-2-enyl diphosphate reductase [Treponema sp.]|nr:4-hydroxy-3-methylbut-2-enyl diphosphate reductase [Treponema sp.]